MLNWQIPVKSRAQAVCWQEPYTAIDYELAKTASKTGELCSKCGTTEAPEWRRGPLGPRTLCNRCGLRYSREQDQQVQSLRKMAIKSLLNNEDVR